MTEMNKDVEDSRLRTQENSVDDEHVPDSPETTAVDRLRRRLLKFTAYAAPFILTFGLPEAGRAGVATACPPPQCRCGNRCGHASPSEPKPQKQP